MWASNKRNFYSHRRRRKGRKSLYTRRRCSPDPWQGSPPKTPPSSDDESVEKSGPNTTDIHIQNSNSRKLLYDCSSDDYAQKSHKSSVHSLHSLSRVSLSSLETTVAPVPLPSNISNIAKRGNNKNQRRRRLNAVKRKLSQYVKMENANVLQSHQLTKKQTKLQKMKKTKFTAPVPLKPLGTNQNSSNITAQYRLTKVAKSKCVHSSATAPVPIRPKSQKKCVKQIRQNIKDIKLSKQMKKNKLKKESLKKEKISISSEKKEENLIDFASIPEAYYIGSDLSIKESDITTPKSLPKSITNYSDDTVIDEIVIWSTPLTPNTNEQSSNDSQSLNANYQSQSVEVSDFTNSDSINDTPKTSKKAISVSANANHANEEIYFNDTQFTLLANAILNENESETNMETVPSNYSQSSLNNTPFLQTQNTANAKKSHNIWAVNNKYSQSRTLGGLLKHGLPPIATQWFT